MIIFVLVLIILLGVACVFALGEGGKATVKNDNGFDASEFSITEIKDKVY